MFIIGRIGDMNYVVGGGGGGASPDNSFISGGNSNVIEYFTNTTTTSNAVDKGDLSVSRNGADSPPQFSERAYTGGGSGLSSIDYWTIVTGASNAVDKGDLTGIRYAPACFRSSTHGFWVAGSYGGAATQTNIIEYVEDSTSVGVTATDKGDLSNSVTHAACASGASLALIAGGSGNGFNTDTIEYIDNTTSAGNSTDKSNLSQAVYCLAGMETADNGFFAGGKADDNSDVIDWVAITTGAADASDKGDLLQAAKYVSGSSSGDYGFVAGGSTDGGAINVIQYIDISSTSASNAVDKGDMSAARYQTASA